MLNSQLVANKELLNIPGFRLARLRWLIVGAYGKAGGAGVEHGFEVGTTATATESAAEVQANLSGGRPSARLSFRQDVTEGPLETNAASDGHGIILMCFFCEWKLRLHVVTRRQIIVIDFS